MRSPRRPAGRPCGHSRGGRREWSLQSNRAVAAAAVIPSERSPRACNCRRPHAHAGVQLTRPRVGWGDCVPCLFVCLCASLLVRHDRLKTTAAHLGPRAPSLRRHRRPRTSRPPCPAVLQPDSAHVTRNDATYNTACETKKIGAADTWPKRRGSARPAAAIIACLARPLD